MNRTLVQLCASAIVVYILYGISLCQCGIFCHERSRSLRKGLHHDRLQALFETRKKLSQSGTFVHEAIDGIVDVDEGELCHGELVLEIL